MPSCSRKVLECQAVHDRAEHAHVVRASAVHAALLQLSAAEEVAAADHHRDFGAAASDLGDLAGDIFHHIRVNADVAAAEHFTPELEHYSLESSTSAFRRCDTFRLQNPSVLSVVGIP